MKQLMIKAVTVLILLAGLAPAGADDTLRIRVMSQNLYIGAEVGRLLVPEPPAAVLETIMQTNLPARAVEIARAIDDFRPDLIGLQEVSLITLIDADGKILFQLDYLTILLDALAARGEHYSVASVVNNADITLPIDLAEETFGQLLDRDVILARNSTTTTSNAVSANFMDNFIVGLDGFPLEFTRGYTAVDAKVKGKRIRFVNTHLEVDDTPCDTAVGPQICQDLQAAELIDAIADEKRPVLLVGDFNAVPDSTAYQTIADAGYIDTWTIRYPYNDEPGYTCCQAEDLTGPNQLSERIDHIFVQDSGDFPIFSAITTVVGDWEERRTPDGLWYSDHGGPWAKLKTTR